MCKNLGSIGSCMHSDKVGLRGVGKRKAEKKVSRSKSQRVS